MPIFRMPVVLHANCPHANSPHAKSPATISNRHRYNGALSKVPIYTIARKRLSLFTMAQRKTVEHDAKEYSWDKENEMAQGNIKKNQI